jgi:hypothetical protein
MIAEPGSGLAPVFQKEKKSLRALLLLMRAAALKNLEQGKDALGSST